MTDYKIIQTINGPEEVKKLSMEQLEELASEIREALFNRLTKIGGHFGPNFGMVEAEIAMHYVFSSPKDKFIFDVSHQSYPHKILTGRKNGYISDEHFSEDSGYTNPEESEHDFFNVGHTSTSVSLATGLAKARDIKGHPEKKDEYSKKYMGDYIHRIIDPKSYKKHLRRCFLNDFYILKYYRLNPKEFPTIEEYLVRKGDTCEKYINEFIQLNGKVFYSSWDL